MKTPAIKQTVAADSDFKNIQTARLRGKDIIMWREGLIF